MRKFFLTTLSILMWILFLISCFILMPVLLFIWAVTWPFDRNLWLVHRFSCFWGAFYIWMVPLWSLKIEGRKKLKDNHVKILVSNHQSFADILIVNSLFRHFRWTSKVENFKMPFVGWVLTLNRSIKIYRAAGDAFQKFKDQAVKSLAEGNTLAIFPEGTRSRTGEMGKFKEGAFMLALQTKTDIFPMVLDGSAKAIPKKGWVLTGRSKMILKVLDPIPYESFKDMTPGELSLKVHDIIQSALKELRKK
ncbi:MAG: 1-acyl-sn-glycerol-3-phosphate acyltransferase [Bacteroidales bacterium]|nr:1-acyl-sn-glycerol-3-phosphate acyltransferase [Bacteroidales bacterium]